MPQLPVTTTSHVEKIEDVDKERRPQWRCYTKQKGIHNKTGGSLEKPMEKKRYHKIALHHAFLHAYIFSHVEQQTKSYVQKSLLQFLTNIAWMHVVFRDMSTAAIYELEKP